MSSEGIGSSCAQRPLPRFAAPANRGIPACCFHLGGWEGHTGLKSVAFLVLLSKCTNQGQKHFEKFLVEAAYSSQVSPVQSLQHRTSFLAKKLPVRLFFFFVLSFFHSHINALEVLVCFIFFFSPYGIMGSFIATHLFLFVSYRAGSAGSFRPPVQFICL